jgi:uncharacterized protein (UPF0332 family)
VPNIADHHRQAKHNASLYRHLRSNGGYNDWAMTATFYTAVHEVQAFLVARGKTPKNHKDRCEDLRVAWKPAAAVFERLLTRSMQSRYMCWMPGSSDLAKGESTLDRLLEELRKAP